jgi:hypothetical protein
LRTGWAQKITGCQQADKKQIQYKYCCKYVIVNETIQKFRGMGSRERKEKEKKKKRMKEAVKAWQKPVTIIMTS